MKLNQKLKQRQYIYAVKERSSYVRAKRCCGGLKTEGLLRNYISDYDDNQKYKFGVYRMFSRILNLKRLLSRKSFFLFGPRATGKSTLVRNQLLRSSKGRVRYYDLLDAEDYGKLLRRPKLMEEESAPDTSIIVIDEIQKLPGLLDECHRLIEKRKLKFLLTGSSARKLKRGAANLLAGRAWEARLHPLVSAEIPAFDLLTYLNSGGLPNVYGSKDWEEELRAYVNTYLREEIQAEALTRNIAPFARFLDAVGLSHGEELSSESLASDCGVGARTVQNYVEVLEDTLVGFRVAPFLATTKRKAITRSKLFLFDVGVANALANRTVRPRSESFGRAFEHFIVCEIRAWLSYSRSQHPLQYWRSTSGFEVDFVVGKEMAIEVKASELVQDKHIKGLRAIKEEKLIRRYLVVSLDAERRRTSDGIEILPWKDFLSSLWKTPGIIT